MSDGEKMHSFFFAGGFRAKKFAAVRGEESLLRSITEKESRELQPLHQKIVSSSALGETTQRHPMPDGRDEQGREVKGSSVRRRRKKEGGACDNVEESRADQ